MEVQLPQCLDQERTSPLCYVLQVFLGGLIGSTFAQQINQFFKVGPAAAVDILGTYLPASSNFFLSYVSS